MVRFNFLTLTVCLIIIQQSLSAKDGQQTEPNPKETGEADFADDYFLGSEEAVDPENRDEEAATENKKEIVNQFWKSHQTEVECWKHFGNRLYETLHQVYKKPTGKETLTTIYKELETSLKDKTFLKVLQTISNEARDTLKDEVVYDLIKNIAKIVYTVLTKYPSMEKDIEAIEKFVTENFTKDKQLAAILLLNAVLDSWDKPEIGFFFKALKEYAENPKMKPVAEQRQLGRQELLDKFKATRKGLSRSKSI